MCQPGPNETGVLSDTEKKRKSSTCMEANPDFPYKRLQIQNNQSSSSLMMEAVQ